jgi:hypothetical protein
VRRNDATIATLVSRAEAYSVVNAQSRTDRPCMKVATNVERTCATG